MTRNPAVRAVLALYARCGPHEGAILEQQTFLEEVRRLETSWVDLARGVDRLVAGGYLRFITQSPYGWQLTASGATLVAKQLPPAPGIP